MVLPSGVSAWSRVVHFFTDASLQPVHPEVAHLDVAEGGAQGEVPACIGRPVLEIEDQIAVVVILNAPTVGHELDFLRHVGLQQDPGGRKKSNSWPTVGAFSIT